MSLASNSSDVTAAGPAYLDQSGSWWATPTLIRRYPDAGAMNAALRQLILQKEREFASNGNQEPIAGLHYGLTTMWRHYNVLNWSGGIVAEFRELLLGAVRDYLALLGDPSAPAHRVVGIGAWANVLRHGESLQLHHHDQAFANAHYIVWCEQSARPESGNTVYYRPGFIDRSHGERRSEALSPWDNDWRVSRPAEPGTLVLFPGYVRHEVRPYLASGERISIACDIYIAAQEPMIYFGGPNWYVP